MSGGALVVHPFSRVRRRTRPSPLLACPAGVADAHSTHWLETFPDPERKNPLCGATKWGLKALAIAANVGCCSGGAFACIACSIGLDGVKTMINAIDCNKECKPECPVA